MSHFAIGSEVNAIIAEPTSPPTKGPVERYPTCAASKFHGGAAKISAWLIPDVTYHIVNTPEHIASHAVPTLRRVINGLTRSLMILASSYVPVYTANSWKVFFGDSGVAEKFASSCNSELNHR